MSGCDRCPGDDTLAYSCNYCSGSFCSTHRLPENHNCPGLRSATTLGPEFRGFFDSGSGVFAKLFGDSSSEDAIAREHHPGMKDYKSDIHTDTQPTGYTPDTSSPDVNPDGSIKHQDGGHDVSDPRNESRVRGAAMTLVGFFILAVTLPFNILLNLPQYLRAFNRWLAQLLGALYGVAKTLAPIALILVGGVFVAGLIGTGFAPIDDTAQGSADLLSSFVNATTDDGMNESLVQHEFAKKLNEERTPRGLDPVGTRQILHAIGDDHAENMRKHDYIGHTQPDGTMISDRYRDRGLLPQCRLPTDDGRYYNGAENVAGAHTTETVTHPGTSEYYNIDSEEELAAFLLDSWMSSDGHRKVLLLESANEIGLGIAIADDGEVYAALEFC